MHSSPYPLQTTKEQSNPNPGIILFFNDHSKRQKKMQSCIFCGKTSPLQDFKGKTVCSPCLQSIPELFSTPSHYVT